MEPTVDAMTNLLTTVGTIITSFLSWFASVSTALISNELILLMLGIGIAVLMFRIGVGLVGKASFRKRGKRR